ncbi:MAG: hypothetical protein HQK75_02410 [Candidatus Magnetomorum sp.]|nr:hypothetical protein [Candidatus Magnetomorum sp.]
MQKKRKCQLLLRILLAFSIMATGSLGCARISKMATTVGINMGIAPAIPLMVDKLKDTKSGRLAEKGFAGQLLMVTGFVELSPNNEKLLNEAAFLYCSYGIFMEDKEPEFAKELYEIGKDYGLRALKQNKKFRKGLERGEKICNLVKHIGKSQVPALVWTGLNSGLWIVLNMDDPEALMGMADTIALIKRSLELDSTFYYGAGKMFLGAYYAMIPEYLGLGGGPDNSKKMFAEARAVENGKFLLVDVLKARYLSTTIEDEIGFEKLLNDVIASDPSELKGIRLINELSKTKARYYLENKGKFF